MKSALSSITSLMLAVVCSWYGGSFAGRPTASGELYSVSGLTCASNQHKLGTRLRLTSGGNSVIVRVNDRTAKNYANRIDLSPAAFTKLAGLKTGLVEASVEVLP